MAKDSIVDVQFDLDTKPFDDAVDKSAAHLRKFDEPLSKAAVGVNRLESELTKSTLRFRESKQSIIGTHRNMASMPGVIQKFNGSMIELTITMGSFALAASPFVLLTQTAIATNAQIEESKLGMASIITAVADVTDATGRQLKGVEALNAVMVVSGDLQNQLRIDALTTAATFEDLSNAFQTGLASGLQSGMNIDEIEKITVRVAQAAGTMQMPMNQLSEEIRALFTGNISTRDSRIATRLGITPKMIADAKASAGGLFKFLNEKFLSFGVAGDLAAEQWNAKVANTISAAQMLIGEGMLPVFDYLKKEIGLVHENILVVDKDLGVMTLNPKLVSELRGMSAGLISFAESAKSVISILTAVSDVVGVGGIVGALYLGHRALSKSEDGMAKYSQAVGSATTISEKFGGSSTRVGRAMDKLTPKVEASAQSIFVGDGALGSWNTTVTKSLPVMDKFKIGLFALAEMAAPLIIFWSISKAIEATTAAMGTYEASQVAAKSAVSESVNALEMYNKILDRASLAEKKSIGFFGLGRGQEKDALIVSNMIHKLNLLRDAKRKVFFGGDTSFPGTGSGKLEIKGKPEGESDAQKRNRLKLASFAAYSAKRSATLDAFGKSDLQQELANNKIAMQDKIDRARVYVDELIAAGLERANAEAKVSEVISTEHRILAQKDMDTKDKFRKIEADKDKVHKSNLLRQADKNQRDKMDLDNLLFSIEQRNKINNSSWDDGLAKAEVAAQNLHEANKRALDAERQLLITKHVSMDDVNASYNESILSENARFHSELMDIKQSQADEDEAKDDERNQLKLEKIAAHNAAVSALQVEIGNLMSANNQVDLEVLLSNMKVFNESSVGLWESGNEGKMKVIGEGLKMASGLMNSENRRLFEIGKAASAGSATISGIEATQDAIKWGNKVGGPWMGAAAGIAVGAAAASNVMKILSTPYGGGGARPASVSAPSSSSSSPAVGVQSQTTNTQATQSAVGGDTYVVITGNVNTRDFVRDSLIPELRAADLSGNMTILDPAGMTASLILDKVAL